MFFQDVPVHVLERDAARTRLRNDLGNYSVSFAVPGEQYPVYRAAGTQSLEYGLPAFNDVWHIIKDSISGVRHTNADLMYL
jgi:hypothetical protein